VKTPDSYESPGEDETFCSDVIDLNMIDLSGLDRLPSPVLRASLRRVCRELADDAEVSAYFQNSLRHLRPADESYSSPAGDGDAKNTGQLGDWYHLQPNRTSMSARQPLSSRSSYDISLNYGQGEGLAGERRDHGDWR